MQVILLPAANPIDLINSDLMKKSVLSARRFGHRNTRSRRCQASVRRAPETCMRHSKQLSNDVVRSRPMPGRKDLMIATASALILCSMSAAGASTGDDHSAASGAVASHPSREYSA
jgi:hypothetical protein